MARKKHPRRKDKPAGAQVPGATPNSNESSSQVAMDSNNKKRKRRDGDPDKEAKSVKKPRDGSSGEATALGVLEEKEPVEDTTFQQDFIPFEDEPAKKAHQLNPPKGKKKNSKPKKGVKPSEQQAALEAIEEPMAQSNRAEALPSDDQNTATEGNTPADAPVDAQTAKKDRFIVFVGNLPFSATKEQMETHFAKVAPSSVRIQTYKESGKCRGFGFLEFERFDRMETCLKKYNHSMFPDARKKEGRKINIELTAGGGGNNASRKSKIQAKNDKLANERQHDREKRDEIEAKQAERKEKKEVRQKYGKGRKKVQEAPAPVEAVDAESGMHPSRLARMQEPAIHNWQPTRTRF
ncbi:hypothetical protein CC78DRAFT_611043 [Lojkania enalia]|uniref:RRM domain-containing protein n=1 Tax=Lojkania enalia TaxID=147567 RepID=A0A9P4TS43_9PLEO|nr:hypothetical protein CC78DRAFT_611043 [Didymosphaeria enalia]